MLLRQIRIQYTLLLTNLLIRCLKREQMNRKICIVGAVDFLDTVRRRKSNLLLISLIKTLLVCKCIRSKDADEAREVIADKGIWTAKKRYILNAWDIEGVRYKDPSLKIMGASRQSSQVRLHHVVQRLKKDSKVIMSGTEKDVNNFIQEFREEFMKLSPEEIVFPRSVNGIDKWSDSSNFQERPDAYQRSHLIQSLSETTETYREVSPYPRG